MEYWYESLKDLGELKLNKIMPNLDMLETEINQRFIWIERMSANEIPNHVPLTSV